ncbi:MAG: carbohydrate binding family 9 domain-containing protein, partial [Ginsengibacter sp.]
MKGYSTNILKRIVFFIASFLFLFSFNAFAQKKNEAYQLHIHRAATPIKVDGSIDDEAWQQADSAHNFYMVLPMDTSYAQVKTEVRMCYDDHNFYLIATCYKLQPGRYFVQSLRRDFSFGKNDNFLVFIDPFNDLTNGFSFGANAAGAQWDGTMYDGSKVDLNWDNKWTSQVKNDEDKWVFEMAIPFSTMRYKNGVNK